MMGNTMTFSRRKREYIGYSALAIVILFFFFFCYQLSAYYPFNPFFPPSGKMTHFVELTYPPISNGKVQELLFDAKFDVVSDGQIAEGVNMTILNPRISVYGGMPINKYIIHNISGVNIVFQDAQPMGGSLKLTVPLDNFSQTQYVYYNLPPGASFRIDENMKFPVFPREPVYELNLSHGYLEDVIQNRPFNFPVSGDYSPSIILEYSNGSDESYTYYEMKLHVAPKSTNPGLHSVPFSNVTCTHCFSLGAGSVMTMLLIF